MFTAKSGYLRVEHQVALCVRFLGCCEKSLEEFRARQHQIAVRRGGEAFDKGNRLRHSGRWIEHSPVGHYAYEFRDTENGERPALRSFGEGDESRRRSRMQLCFGTVGVDQYICVDGDHARSITS